MAIYARNITKQQLDWLKLYESTTTFEPLHQDELTNGEMTFADVAKANLNWFEEWMHDAFNVVSTNVPDCGGTE